MWQIILVFCFFLITLVVITKKMPSHSKKTTQTTSGTQKTEQKRKASRKGELGEYKIQLQLNSLPSEYKHINDVMLKTSKGLTQIDHIVISPYGIFVIETKNFAGWIFGNQQDKYWTQTFYKKKTRFYNPIRQNFGHIKALQDTLKGHKNMKFHPIISFSRRCELRDITADVPVILDTEISRVILRKNTEKYLDDTEVANIYNTLRAHNIVDGSIRQQHIQQIKSKYSNK